MYPLDNVKTVSRTHTDISWIPANIQELYLSYSAIVLHYDPCMNTAAQKRTSTMRFNKLCKACDDQGIDLAKVLFCMVNR